MLREVVFCKLMSPLRMEKSSEIKTPLKSLCHTHEIYHLKGRKTEGSSAVNVSGTGRSYKW